MTDKIVIHVEIPMMAKEYEVSLIVEGYNSTATEVRILREKRLYHSNEQRNIQQENY